MVCRFKIVNYLLKNVMPNITNLVSQDAANINIFNHQSNRNLFHDEAVDSDNSLCGWWNDYAS